MYDVSLFVDHDVAIVSVLDLKQVAHQRVGSHTLDEVSTSLWGCSSYERVEVNRITPAPTKNARE